MTADEPVRALAFDRDKLNQVFRNDTDVAGLIYQLLGRELARKTKISNTLLAAVQGSVQRLTPRRMALPSPAQTLLAKAGQLRHA